ncbi:MAG TPA: hypothetical protein PKA59_00535 [Chakrabartia sp.]|jgi:hypothetical protein|nr:hypothetical protein [Chakrabartia sp.]
MKKLVLGAALSMLLAAPAHAEITVGMFLAKAEAVKAGKDPNGRKILRAEMDRADRDFQTRYRSGAIRDVCIKGSASLEPEFVLNYFRSLPPPQRAMTGMNAGFYGAMKKRFPCW